MMSSKSPSFLTKALLKIIAVYRYILSPLLGSNCRYYPSCSAFTQEAIIKHGAIKGGWIGLKRLLRCHPFHPGGYDPVPQPTESTSQK